MARSSLCFRTLVLGRHVDARSDNLDPDVEIDDTTVHGRFTPRHFSRDAQKRDAINDKAFDANQRYATWPDVTSAVVYRVRTMGDELVCIDSGTASLHRMLLFEKRAAACMTNKLSLMKQRIRMRKKLAFYPLLCIFQRFIIRLDVQLHRPSSSSTQTSYFFYSQLYHKLLLNFGFASDRVSIHIKYI